MITSSTPDRQFLYFVLLLSKGIGPVAISEIQRSIAFSNRTDDEIGHAMTSGVLPDYLILKEKHRQAIQQTLGNDACALFDREIQQGHRIICPNDDVLPHHYWHRSSLHRLPVTFIAKGEVPPTDVPWLSIIGSRNATDAGLQRAEHAGRSNAAAGAVTISGGARGADTTAINAATVADGWTVIVPSSDLSPLPPQPKQLIITAYPPGTTFTPGLAMARNAIVVALSQSMYVAEVQPGKHSAPSGTQHAINLASEYGVPVVLG